MVEGPPARQDSSKPDLHPEPCATWLRVIVSPALSIGTLLWANDSLGQDVMSLPEDTGATAWMLTSTALVLLMVPGLAMFYGGLVRTKNVLGTMMHSFASMAILGVLWPVLGYALAFGTSHGGVVGWDNQKAMLAGIDETWVAILNGTARIPEYVFAMFQLGDPLILLDIT
jgi:Amt family ammonium transporter